MDNFLGYRKQSDYKKKIERRMNLFHQCFIEKNEQEQFEILRACHIYLARQGDNNCNLTININDSIFFLSACVID